MIPATVTGLLDELGQLKLAGHFSEKFLEAVIRHPVRLAAKKQNADYQGQRSRHFVRSLNEAVEEGYPAGWVALGMRPTPGE